MAGVPSRSRVCIGSFGLRAAALSLAFLVGGCSDEQLKPVGFCTDRSDYKIYTSSILHNGFPAFNSSISETAILEYNNKKFNIIELPDSDGHGISISCDDKNITIKIDSYIGHLFPDGMKINISVEAPPARPVRP
jgi:hypothetical protein